MALRPFPSGLHAFSPSVLIATVGGAGRLQPASGTWGSLAALAIGLLWISVAPASSLLIGAVLAYAVGAWACTHWLKHDATEDPQAIVIDELVGMWMALSVAPPHIWGYLGAFVLFRFFDIVKLWPANWIDQNIDGPHGIMADDVIAGLYAMAILMLIQYFN